MSALRPISHLTKSLMAKPKLSHNSCSRFGGLQPVFSHTLDIHGPQFLSRHFTVLSDISLKGAHSLGVSNAGFSSSAIQGEHDTSPPSEITKETANSFVMKLNGEQRATLLNLLQQYESEQLKAEYKGQLAAFRWRSKLGRPSKVPRLGDVDPTGSYCPVPEDWLLQKYAETIPKPTTNQLFAVAVHNAVPFIGFGFLDNFLMIICGDYIEMSLGMFMTISTMAAAALGNTFSDILGLGAASYVERIAAKIGVNPPLLTPAQLAMPSSRTSANFGDYIELKLGSFMTISTMAAAALGNTMGDVLGLGCATYVETIAAKVGVKPPRLSPIQLNMKASRAFANVGRGIGVTIGCLLGMLPLLFMNTKDKESESKEKKTE